MSLLWPPITTPQLGGVIEVTFFEKMIRCGAREKTNIWRPWCQELRKRQRWIGILENWGCFLQNYELLLGQYSKISNQWNFLGKDTNFDWFFYVMQALTQNPAKNLTMFQIPKFNFKKSLVLISMLWYPKYIDIWLTPFGPPCGAIQGAILRVP